MPVYGKCLLYIDGVRRNHQVSGIDLFSRDMVMLPELVKETGNWWFLVGGRCFPCRSTEFNPAPEWIPRRGMARLGNNSIPVPSKFSRGRCLNCYSGPVQSIAGFFTCLVSECIQAIRIVLDFQGIQEKTGKHPLFIAENAAGPKPWFIYCVCFEGLFLLLTKLKIWTLLDHDGYLYESFYLRACLEEKPAHHVNIRFC
uniref:Uncharacterized protein n=1 Tax=Salix viminalis TaxID=40686 RepID=A0A6N2NCR5_SALVM